MTTPEANNSLSRVVSDLNDIMVNSGVPDLNYSVQANDEAEKIMNEATKLAEQKTMTKLPQVPANVTEDKEIT